jgi:Zn-dependent peptidase ImmA (M78 family)
MNHHLFRQALIEASKVRAELDYSMFQPINIFDTCKDLGVTVRFVDINMEGMYVEQESGKNPTILISNQRPFSRRCFTCAHELGHHRFGHGTRLDTIAEDQHQSAYNEEELLVDSFAGALLMPVAGIQAEFSKRNLNPNNATPVYFYSIASVFGVGYKTLLLHCRVNDLISRSKEASLSKFSPSKILENIVGPLSQKPHFKIFESHYSSTVIDVEVSNFLIMPHGTVIEGNHLEHYKETPSQIIYKALMPGIVRAYDSYSRNGVFIRIQKKDYVGLAENRHLEIIEP